MGCIRVDKITEYLCEPLRKCLKDEDPYVRKTAAVCVAKLHDINAQLVEDQGFLDTLKDLISDSNPMVIIFCLLDPPFIRMAVNALHLHTLTPFLLCSHSLSFWCLTGHFWGQLVSEGCRLCSLPCNSVSWMEGFSDSLPVHY